jgi:hypothetical protein
MLRFSCASEFAVAASEPLIVVTGEPLATLLPLSALPLLFARATTLSSACNVASIAAFSLRAEFIGIR